MPVPIERRKDNDASRERMLRTLIPLQHRGWYGTLTLRLEKGLIKVVKVEQVDDYSQPEGVP